MDTPSLEGDVTVLEASLLARKLYAHQGAFVTGLGTLLLVWSPHHQSGYLLTSSEASIPYHSEGGVTGLEALFWSGALILALTPYNQTVDLNSCLVLTRAMALLPKYNGLKAFSLVWTPPDESSQSSDRPLDH